MTVTSGFYNSVAGDRTYDAEDFGGVFDGIIEDGIAKGFGGDFRIDASGVGNGLIARTGRGWFNSRWVLNDADYPFTGPNADVALPRIDAVVLRVNTDPAVRATTLVVKQGTPNATPVIPAMTRTATVNEYPLASIERTAGSTSITQARITQLVGTPATPWAASRLQDPAFDPAPMHRNVFRGKFLGTSLTPEQLATIRSGAFEDLYVGDYWTIGGQNWRIADIDYYYGRNRALAGTVGQAHNSHHLLIMPDKTIRIGKLNESFGAANTGAYYGISARGTHLVAMLNTVEGHFGVGNILNFETVFTTVMSAGMPANAVFGIGRLELPTQAMIWGHDLWNPRARGENNPPSVQNSEAFQAALFRLAPQFIMAANTETGNDWRTTWTRDVVGPVAVAVVGAAGENTYAYSSNAYGFRPYFLIG